MRQRLAHKSLLTLALIAFPWLSASASVIGPITTSTPVATTLTDLVSGLTFPQFNGALGTLLSVEITTAVGLDTQLSITNTSTTGASSTGHVRTEVFVTLSDPLADFSEFTDTVWPAAPPVPPGFAYNLAPGASLTSGTLTSGASSDTTFNAGSVNGPAILSEFTGAGNIVLPVSTFTQTVLSNSGGNTSSSQVTHASVTGTVTFTFNAAAITTVPEPGTVTTLAAALLALGLFARKRLRQP